MPLRTLILLSFVLCSADAAAELRSQYGVGSASAALAGSDRAKAYDGLAVLNNPALMSEQYVGRATFGFFGAVDSFTPASNIVVNNTTLGASSRETGNVSTDVPDVFLAKLGATIALGKSESHYRLGFGFMMPVERVAGPNSQDYYTPQYAIYNADSQRLVIGTGFSFKPIPQLSLGFGGQAYMTSGATVTTKLPQQPSTSRVNQSTQVQPAFGPQVGLVFTPVQHHRLSLSWAMERDYRLDFDSKNSVYLIGSSAPFNFRGSQSLFYDPEVWSAAYCLEVGRVDLHAAVEYERWSQFDGHMVKIDFDTFQGSFRQLQPNTQYRDIVVPRFGTQFRISQNHAFRAGYAFRPSPVPDLGGETNFLDSDRHVIAAGHAWRTPWNVGGSTLRLDWHMQLHHLVRKEVVKRSPDFVGAAATTGGAPMVVEGNVFSYGMTVSVDI